MSSIDNRDREILGFIIARGEVFFKELAESNMMAKETLSNHLRKLREMELVKKSISKKRMLGPAKHDVVYVVTRKGEEVYSKIPGRHMKLWEFE